MNKNNKVTLTDTTDKPVLNYSIYYWNYRIIQPVKTLLYVGKAYNFNNASSVDIYLNDIIKSVPAASGYYDIRSLYFGIGFYTLNLVTNLEVVVEETGITHKFYIYQDNTKSYFVGQDLTNIEPGTIKEIPNIFKKLNKLHSGTDRQLSAVFIGNFDDDEIQWGLEYTYTDGTKAQHLIGAANLFNDATHRVAVKFDCNENYLFDNNPQPSKTVKYIKLQYLVTPPPGGLIKKQEFVFVSFTNEDCEHDVLSFENRNGSISYLQLKGNTIYSESITHHKKIDMFDNETVYASLVDETITVNTGWLTDEEAKALEDLYVSKKIFLFDTTLGKYLAVNVDESEYKQRLFKNEKHLKNYTIKLKLQQKEVL
jgi:hypothetical protein